MSKRHAINRHKGEIIEAAIRQSQYPLSTVMKRMKLSRSTLYNRFKEHHLEDAFILALGEAIHYDFSLDFPALKPRQGAPKKNKPGNVSEILRLEKMCEQAATKNQHLSAFINMISPN